MATIKSYTDIEQSKKLAKFLPIESADMFLAMNGTIPVMSKYIDDGLVTADETAIPCWSLAALLSVLDFPSLTQNKEDEWETCVPNCESEGYIEVSAGNPVDACVTLIEKLHKLNLL